VAESSNVFYAVGSGWDAVTFAASGPSGMMAVHTNYAGAVVPAKANYGTWQSWDYLPQLSAR
jgi:Cys-tRNA synthase (O-phospho-L-seryl-tRNA:Cys-tRNA synthase)